MTRYNTSVTLLPNYYNGNGQPTKTLDDSVNGFPALVGMSKPMHEIFATIKKVGPSDVTVLIMGESGTGKNEVARALHYVSNRRDKVYTSIDCSTRPEGLIDDELFGHIRGAFSDAIRDRKGVFEFADGGTIFINEIGNLSLYAR